MPNQPLLLSAHQKQILSDLGIDAWYLKPLTKTANDGQQQAIDALVESLTDTLKNADDIAPKQSKLTEVAVKSSVAEMQPTLAESETADKTNDSVKTPSVQTQPRDRLPDKIHLAAKKPQIPEGTMIDHRDRGLLSDVSWAAVEDEITTLNSDSAMQVKGLGDQNADWVFITPPALKTVHDADNDLLAQTLFAEWLTALGKNKDDIYTTPLLKERVKIPRDPDADLLTHHLPILFTELALTQPKHVFLMGRQVCQALLATQVSLSKLSKTQYQLRYGDAEGDIAAVTCLPTMDYFVAAPVQKSWLWKASKSLIRK